MFDDAAAARMVVEHLAELGHERIAFLAPSEPSWSVAQRETAYRENLRRLNLEYSVRLECLPSPRAGEDVFDSVFRELSKPSGESPSAVFAFDDIIALNLIRRLIDGGLRVPEDVSVVGMDDISIGELAVVPLTTVALDSPSLGDIAVELLMGRLEGKRSGDIRDVKLEPRFVKRSSTASVASN
jgi:DNA-binding LacI/PurR family transcriptional regulator